MSKVRNLLVVSSLPLPRRVLLSRSPLLSLSAMDKIVLRQLHRARRRLVVQQSVNNAFQALFISLSVLAIGRAVSLVFPTTQLFWPVTILALLLLSLAPLTAYSRWRSLSAVARELDACAETKDRFLTALTLPPGERHPVVGAARRETSAFASTLQLDQYLRLALPVRGVLWLAVPLMALGILEGIHSVRAKRAAPELAMARNLLERARHAATLETRKEELSQVVKLLEDTQKQLTSSQEPMRDALRALTELEQAFSPQAQLDPAETVALAEALARRNSELASNLRSGKSTEAAKGVAQLDPAELAKALEEAARHLDSRRLQELAAQKPVSAKLMLENTLSSSSSETGCRFASVLQSVKSGLQIPEHEREKGTGGVATAPARKHPDGSGDDGAEPTGEPGSEKDVGRGRELSEDAEPAISSADSEDFLAGQMGEGASLVKLFQAAGNDDPQARRAYHSAYNRAASAALETVVREQVPTGSQLLVRRYFESIRPKE